MKKTETACSSGTSVNFYRKSSNSLIKYVHKDAMNCDNVLVELFVCIGFSMFFSEIFCGLSSGLKMMCLTLLCLK
jgi:hypothetical protein